MRSKIFQNLTVEQLETANGLSTQFLKGIVGHNVIVTSASVAMVAEFLLRHNVFDLDDLLDAINHISEYRDSAENMDGVINLGDKNNYRN